MSIWDSLIISAFGLGIVFVVLIGLSLAITLESKAFDFFKHKKSNAEKPVEREPETAPHATAGELKLIDVEERTAAMIMAIVSDESGIPLSELQFKSIKALD
ncbi:MAG: OadG family protein [Clostridiaceae bacterium]|jgi:Na+-transporting methylmalonyl-CoA/oxaloacetate decarboxylase gamma subunit|nr:OadG family protein [Clostridiaceae bacterium]